tara:strand:- start:36 stop:392 length:357 start_codon:yes stop_codon:yes gene_type:complete
MSHNETIKEAKDIIGTIPSGTLIQFSQQAHYSKNKDTRDYAIISSTPTPEKNHKWYAISNAFTHLHKCSIIWNNKEHTAFIYYEKNYPKRFYLKIQYGFINARPHTSSHLPILHWCYP